METGPKKEKLSKEARETALQEFKERVRKRSSISDKERLKILMSKESAREGAHSRRHEYYKAQSSAAEERDKQMITSQDILELYELEKEVHIKQNFLKQRRFERQLDKVIAGLLWATENPGICEFENSDIDAGLEFIKAMEIAKIANEKMIAIDQFLNYIHSPPCFTRDACY